MVLKILPMLFLLLSSKLSNSISLFLLPDEDIVHHCTSTKYDAYSNQDTRYYSRSRMELDKGVKNNSCEEHGDGHEEAPHRTHPRGGRLPQVLVRPVCSVRRPGQLDGEQELHCAYEQAAEIEGEGERAQSERRLVHEHVLVGRRQVERGRARKLQQGEEGEQGEEEGGHAHQPQRAQRLLNTRPAQPLHTRPRASGPDARRARRRRRRHP